MFMGYDMLPRCSKPIFSYIGDVPISETSGDIHVQRIALELTFQVHVYSKAWVSCLLIIRTMCAFESRCGF